jgi:putative tricarboxylic transport membrane protein
LRTVSKGKGYLVVGGGGLVLAAAYLAAAVRLPFGKMDQPGAAVFPMMVAALLVAASLAVMWEGWSVQAAEPVEMPHGQGLGRMLGLVGALLAYMLLLPWLGQLLAGFAFCLALMRLLAQAETTAVSWLRIAASAAVMSGAIYVLFVHLLMVPMPRGILAP